MVNRVIMLSGLTACGKTTAARALQQRFGYSLISTHQIKHALRLEDTCSESERELAYAEVYRQTRQALRDRHSVILDAGFNTRAQRRPVFHLTQTQGADLYLLNCVCDDLVTLCERIRRRALDPDKPEHQAHSMETYWHVSRSAEPVGPIERPLAAGLLVYDTLRHRLQSSHGDAFMQEMRRALVCGL
jgi:predicted kinase